jgi:hypothetical protein
LAFDFFYTETSPSHSSGLLSLTGSPPFSQTKETPALVFENSRFPSSAGHRSAVFSLNRPKPNLLPHLSFPYKTQPPEQPQHNTSLSSLSSPSPKRPANHYRLSIFPDLFISQPERNPPTVFSSLSVSSTVTTTDKQQQGQPPPVIPPCRRPPETEKKVKQRKKQIYRRNISKKGEDREQI